MSDTQRWLVTTREDRGHAAIYETVEIAVHPVDYLNDLEDAGVCGVALVLALKLHPEDPELDR